MQIKSVLDSSFKKYGKVVKGIDCSKMLEALSKKPMPADSVVYVPGDADLEAAAGAIDFSKSFFGGLEAQIGYCNGNNKLLNAVEYHRCSEVNIADDFTYDTSKIEAYKIPAGTAVELYATTLHYAPCNGEPQGFRVIVVLPKGTNYDIKDYPDKTPEDRLLMAQNKWLIAHKDGGQDPRAFIGLKGENVSI